MAKNYTEAELRVLSKEIFNSNPGQTKLLATTDGNFFLEKNRQEAVQHAQKENLEVVEVSLADSFIAKMMANVQDRQKQNAQVPAITPEPEVKPDPEVNPKKEEKPASEKAPKAPTKKKTSTK